MPVIISGRIPENGYSKNDMIFEERTVVWPARPEPAIRIKDYFNTASSQFFITVEREI